MRNWSVLLARGGTGFGLHDAGAVPFIGLPTRFALLRAGS